MMNLGSYLRGVSFTEYRTRPENLADLLPWGLLIKPGLGITKFGAFFTTVRFRGPDLASSTGAELIAVRAQINNALRRLGSRWCLHIEAQRLPSRDYPEGEFPDHLSGLVDQERRMALHDQIVQSFESEHYLTFTYLPPEDRISRAESLLYENATSGGIEDAYRQQLRYFEQTVANIVSVLRGAVASAEPLDDSALLTYLHNCITDRPHEIAAPEVPMYLDALLSDTPLTGGLAPVLGRDYLGIIGVKSYPNRTLPLLLDELNELGFAYRWVARFMPLSKTDAQSELARIKKRWFAKRKGMMTLIREAMVKEESRLEDSDATNKAENADAALQALGDDATSFGFFTPVIIVGDRDPTQLQWKIEEVQRVLDSRGLVSVLEEANALDAWLGSLPAHPYANIRRPPVSSMNLVDLMPLSGVWAGERINQHLKAPAMLLARTQGSTPFRLNLHHDDVGHSLMAGPTGAGKSALLCFMAMQWRRYPDGQVIIFDNGGSARCATHMVRGQYFPLGSSESGLSFQPLADVHDELERVWAQDWLSDLFVQEGIVMDAARREALWLALSNMAAQEVPSRTLTVLRSLLQDLDMKQALGPFVEGEGAHGSLLDADFDKIGDASWQCYEMEELYKRPQALGPVLTYLFHRIERQFDGRPTLLIIDEGWAALRAPSFTAKIEEWLRTLRRRNVSVVFANQDLRKIVESPIAPVLIENCLTRIYLANRAAAEPTTRKIYESFGLNGRQIEIISKMTRRREYYYESPDGNRTFELGLSPLAVAACASSSRRDLREIDRIWREHGDAGFADAWLAYKGIPRDHIERVAAHVIIHDGVVETTDVDDSEGIEIVEPGEQEEEEPVDA